MILTKIKSFLRLEVLVVVIFAVLGSTAVGWYFRAQALEAEKDQFEVKVKELIEVNQHNAETLDELAEIREKDLEYYGELTRELDNIAGEYGQLRSSMRRLEGDNEEIRDYMSQRVPGDVVRLRDEQRKAHQDGD